MAKSKLSLEAIAAADQGEAAALQMLDQAVEMYIDACSKGTRTEALVAINNGLIVTVRNGKAINIVGMLSTAIAKLGDQKLALRQNEATDE